MVPGHLHKPLDLRKSVLVNYFVRAKVDVVHSLLKIYKSPTVRAQILGRLQLVIENQKLCKLQKIRASLSQVVTKSELDQEAFYLVNLTSVDVVYR